MWRRRIGGSKALARSAVLVAVLVTAAAACPNGDDDDDGGGNGAAGAEEGPVPTANQGTVDDGDGPGPLERRVDQWYELYEIGDFPTLRAQLEAVESEPPADVDPGDLDEAVTVFETLLSLDATDTATSDQIDVLTDLGDQQLVPSLELAVTAALTEATNVGVLDQEVYVDLVDPRVVTDLLDDGVIGPDIVPPGVLQDGGGDLQSG